MDTIQKNSKTGVGKGKLVATILSLYDLPSEMVPSTVSLMFHDGSCAVETGPPTARHKDKNAFRFQKNSSMTTSSTEEDANPNELVINGPLSDLYAATVTFRVRFVSDKIPDLISNVKISSALQINQTQWLILNLLDEKSQQQKKKEEGEESPENDTSSSSSLQVPTLRLKLRLNGDYRPEISALIAASKSYFGAVDYVSSNTQQVVTGFTKNMPSAKILLVPAVPIATGAVVLSPILLGVLVVGLPFFLPILVVLLSVVAGVSAVGTTLYFSGPLGREQVRSFIEPIYLAFLATQSGQRFIYDTGSRPSPMQLAQIVLPTDIMQKLIVCLIIDFIGSSSYLIPGAGEGFDLFWAPVQTILVAAMFDDISPSLKYVSFVEEILPFTDLVPTASLGWLREFVPVLLQKVQETGVLVQREKMSLQDLASGGVRN